MTRKRPLFVLEVEVDEIQSEKLVIFSPSEIKAKLGQLFKSYGISDPLFKKRLQARVMRFFEGIQEKKMFAHPLSKENNRSSNNHARSTDKGRLTSSKQKWDVSPQFEGHEQVDLHG